MKWNTVEYPAAQAGFKFPEGEFDMVCDQTMT